MVEKYLVPYQKIQGERAVRRAVILTEALIQNRLWSSQK
jgi:hypothetical protein